MHIGKYEVLIMRSDAKPWVIGEKSGVSYSLHFMDEGRVYRAKIDQALYEETKDIIQQEKEVELVLTVFNEVVKLECVNVK